MLTQTELQALFHYDPLTGIFTALTSRRGGCRIGSVVGSPHVAGYLTVMVEGKNYLLHRLAWFYTYGVWPLNDTDHRDGVRSNNRLKNLREATRVENCQNTLWNPGKSGYLGASKVGHRWRVQIKSGNKKHHIGYFDTPELANEAYLAAKAELHTFQPVPRNSPAVL